MIVKRMVSLCFLAMAIFSISGCNMPSKTTEKKTSEVSVLDNPTAEQMHDICGALLMFQNTYKRMPKTLDELVASTGLSKSKIIDPVTKKRFWYTPTGFARSPKYGLIVLLAEPPSSKDICYGIAMWGTLPLLNSRVVPLEAGAWKKLTVGWEEAL